MQLGEQLAGLLALLLQLLVLLQLLTPAAEVFTQMGVTGMGMQPCVQGILLCQGSLQLLLGSVVGLCGQLLQLLVLQPLHALCLQRLGLQVLQLLQLCCMLVVGALPQPVQGGNGLRGAMGLQALQVRCSVLQGLLGTALGALGLGDFLRGQCSLCLPALHGLQLCLLRLQISQRGLQRAGLRLQGGARGLVEQLHALRLRVLCLQRLPCSPRMLKHGL